MLGGLLVLSLISIVSRIDLAAVRHNSLQTLNVANVRVVLYCFSDRCHE